ncbi:MAG: PhnD/SsuA/transferrin family substrate-binding protein [Planctomycetes bacterium]|nr:PhnD/SsuA/transferrin family substrate-binding protein [Planctomycetota bacterium]
MPTAASGTQKPRDDKPALQLDFGVYQSDKATVMYRKLNPVLEALASELDARLDASVDLRLTIFKSYDEGIESLVAGKIDFTRFGPASYITAKQRNDDIQLLAMELEHGERRFLGVIAVLNSSPLQSLTDLKGKRFAFGDPNSTIGRYLAQAELAQAGIRAKDLESYAFLSRHDTVARAVELGDYDAGSMAVNTFEDSRKAGKLRALKTFENVTKPWIARARLAPEVVAALHDSLLALKDPEVLKELKISGFGETSDAEYAFVREGMKRADDFNLGSTKH